MDLVTTWRKHFTLRYVFTRLIRSVFAAGIIYLFSARQAVKGMRPAKKELQYAIKNVTLCIKYLKEIGGTWPSATNLADIIKDIFQTSVKPEIGEHMQISPTSSGILPPKEQEAEHPRTNGAGDGKRQKRSISRKRLELSSVDDNPQDLNNNDSHQRIGNGTLPIPIPPSQTAVHTPVHSPTPAQVLQLPTPPSSQRISTGHFPGLPSHPSRPQYSPVQSTQPRPVSPATRLWTELSARHDPSHSYFTPPVELSSALAPPLSQQPHVQHPFSVSGMSASQYAFVDDSTYIPSTLLGVDPSTSAVPTNGNTAGCDARPMGPMSYPFVMPDGRGFGETPLNAKLGEDPMVALNQLGFGLPQPEGGMSAELMDMDMDMDMGWGEQELCEGLDVAEFTDLWGVEARDG